MDNKMNCEEVCEMVGAYLDGELTREEERMIDQHMAGCPICEGLKKENLALGEVMAHMPRFELPQGLSARLEQRLDVEENRRAVGKGQGLAWGRRFASHLGAMAAGVVIALTSNYFLANERLLGDELVDSHVKHNIARQFGTVLSTDRHTIGPWFSGKVDYVPPVIELADKGFPLLAGWVDVMYGRPVAVLRYGRRKHNISLFVVPKGEGLLPRGSFKHKSGFNLVQWQTERFHFAAISDLNQNDLARFATEHKVVFPQSGNKAPS